MNAPAGTTLTERTEWVFGLGEPKAPSRFWLASFPVLVVVGVGALLWPALSEGQEEAASYPTAALSFLWLSGLAETGGSYLYARRGKRWGRGLRAFGWAAFVPLWMGCYTLWFWSTSSRLGFMVMSALLGFWVVGVAFRFIRLARRRE